MLKTHKISVARDLTHVQLLIQKLKVLLKSLFMNISRKVATIRRTSCIRFKQMNTDDLVSHPRPEDNFNINDCQNDYCRD